MPLTAYSTPVITVSSNPIAYEGTDSATTLDLYSTPGTYSYTANPGSYAIKLWGGGGGGSIGVSGGGSPVSTSFNATGADQTFNVPAGVTSMTVQMWGGGGGSNRDVGAGGGGGYSAGTIAVTPGETLTIRVGVGGQGGGLSTNEELPSTQNAGTRLQGGQGGFPGGGTGGTPSFYGGGGGGGGYSGIFRGVTPLIIAGGGGGGADDASAGAGGGSTGASGATGGTGGSQVAGGTGGAGTSGSSLQGGSGGAGPASGGGGGGYFGGSSGSFWGGGGGGSGYIGGPGVTGASTLGGSGTTPGNSTDVNRGTAGNGAPAGGTGEFSQSIFIGIKGRDGKVIISYTPSISFNESTGGGGGAITSNFSLDSRETWTIYVASGGTRSSGDPFANQGSAGSGGTGYGSGGLGAANVNVYTGGGGGGSTAILSPSRGLLLAAGAGGAAGFASQGGLGGGNGTGAGGFASAPGASGSSGSNGGGGGGSGALSAGGTAGRGGSNTGTGIISHTGTHGLTNISSTILPGNSADIDYASPTGLGGGGIGRAGLGGGNGLAAIRRTGFSTNFVFTVSANVPNGTIYYWTNVGTSDAFDFTNNATSGTVTISNGTGTITLPIISDGVLEDETISLQLREFAATGSLVAQAQVPLRDGIVVTTYVNTWTSLGGTISAEVSVINEGDKIDVDIATSGIPEGTALFWTNAGTTTAADFTQNVNNGTFTVTNSRLSLSLNLKPDSLTEGTETFIAQVRTGSITGPILATSRTITINDTDIFDVWFLLVGGGGSGTRSFNGGSPGGGAGGYIEHFRFTPTVGLTYSITIGGGGAGGGGWSTSNQGNNSQFGDFTALGGGAVILVSQFSENGRPGGSGGGSAPGFRGGESIQLKLSGPFLNTYGNNGASVISIHGDTGGGGGGAGSPGGSPVTIANGGAGILSSITGTPLFYAAGGGGSAYAAAGTPPQRAGAGGSQIGGDGTAQAGASGAVGGSGSINGIRGSGGGGTYSVALNGAGGGGIFIIKYRDTLPAPITVTGSPSLSITNGYRLYTWTGNGSILW